MLADQSQWRMVLTDLSGNTNTGGGQILNASGRQFSYHLNAGKQMQFTITIDNPVCPFMLGNDTLLKVYRSLGGLWILQMVGDIIHVEEAAQGDMGFVTAVAQDPFWRLQRRLLGTAVDALGRGTGFTVGSSISLVDIGQIIFDIVADLNSTFNVGLAGGTLGLTTNSFVGPVYMQNAGDLIQQLLTTTGHPDMQIVPNEPSGAMPSTIIGTMNIGPLGVARPNVIFEYGYGSFSLASYDRILTKDGLANYVFGPPSGFPDLPAAGDTMAVSSDSTSYNAIGLYQDTIQADVVSQTLRQILCDENVAIRKFARQQLTFTPTVNCPYIYGADYNIGDVVGVRAMVDRSFRLNGTARIYGVDIGIDDNDAETPTLTLIPS